MRLNAIANNFNFPTSKKFQSASYLALGFIAMSLAHLTFNIDLLAWIAMSPFLLYLGNSTGLKSRLLFAAVLFLTWSVIILKIITPPIPVFLVFMYAIPISLFHLPGYLLWAHYKDRRFSALIFPAAMVLLEWVQYTFTPLASWGAAAYTQSNNLPVMQVVSVAGLSGLGFLVYWINATLASLLLKKSRAMSSFFWSVIIVLLLSFWGTLRLGFENARGAETIKVATIGTDSEIGGLPLPTTEKNDDDILAILNRTIRAAEAGARIIVWNEAAFLLWPENQDQWINRFRDLAKKYKITLVASHILLTNEEPLQFENRYLLINDRGNVLDTYYKHQPVPGEPAKKGTEAIQTFRVNDINLGGAICYDYDFPYIARDFGNAGADIVALPSSDWRGIDPLHSRMAAFRAVEQGHSIIRSTRYGLSAAITPYGDMVAKQSSFDRNDKIMLANLPTDRVGTIYSFLGDVPIYLCAIFILIITLKKSDE